MNAGPLHFSNRFRAVGGAKIDAAARVLNERGVKSALDRVERGELHAVIGREAADEHFADAALFQPFTQAGGFPVTVIEEAAVAIEALLRLQ